MSSRRPALIGGEAIEQAVAAGAAEVRLAAPAFRTAREMRGVPRPRLGIVAQTLPVDMPDHRRALSAARPVVAGLVLTRGKARPSGCEPVSASCRLGVSPRPFTMSPFSVNAVCLVMLLLSPCNSSTSLAMVTALLFCHGPFPIRSRALTAG